MKSRARRVQPVRHRGPGRAVSRRRPRRGACFPALAAIRGVAVASPVVDVQVRLPGRERGLRLLGIDPFRAADCNPRWPTRSTSTTRSESRLLAEDAVWLSASAATALGLRRATHSSCRWASIACGCAWRVSFRPVAIGSRSACWTSAPRNGDCVGSVDSTVSTCVSIRVPRSRPSATRFDVCCPRGSTSSRPARRPMTPCGSRARTART